MTVPILDCPTCNQPFQGTDMPYIDAVPLTDGNRWSACFYCAELILISEDDSVNKLDINTLDPVIKELAVTLKDKLSAHMQKCKIYTI